MLGNDKLMFYDGYFVYSPSVIIPEMFPNVKQTPNLITPFINACNQYVLAPIDNVWSLCSIFTEIIVSSSLKAFNDNRVVDTIISTNRHYCGLKNRQITSCLLY